MFSQHSDKRSGAFY